VKLLLLLLPAALSAQVWTAALPQPDATEWTPVTQSDRFHHYIGSTFNAGTLAGAIISGGYRQATNQPVEWHQGMAGYGRRVGDNLAKSGVRHTIRYAMAAALKEDNRYISSPNHSTRSRLWYAVSQTYATHDTRGHRRFAFSKFIGNTSTIGISQAWAPPSWQTGRRMGQDFAVISGMQAAINIATEFAPDILKKFKH
jgi:hypothetical protein